MKKFLFLVFTVVLFAVCLLYNNEIINYLVDTFIDFNKEVSKIENNKYASSNNYNFVSITDDFSPLNKDEIINIYYTVINSGMSDFTFYCDKEYKDCIKDVNNISNDQNLLSNINNFVPVYNSFSNIETEFDSLGKVTIHVTHSYNNDQIIELENKVNQVFKDLIKDTMTEEEKIKAIHDYIINNTKYDVDRSDNKITKYSSDIAYGALIEHYAICGGYADSIKLFLDRLNIPNYKISSENHVWNLVYINDDWFHLDLTWDDPVTSTNEDVLEYDYFLITSEELKNMNTDQHGYDLNIYNEAKSN